MKSLIVYYSRTGYTKKVAHQLAAMLKSDTEEIIDHKNRSGILGYLKAGRDASLKKLTHINVIHKKLSFYDLVIVGTPIWAWTVSTPIRSFLVQHKNRLNHVAFFCTMGGSGDDKAFREMQKIISRKPKATLSLLTREVVKDDISDKLRKFVHKLKA